MEPKSRHGLPGKIMQHMILVNNDFVTLLSVSTRGQNLIIIITLRYQTINDNVFLALLFLREFSLIWLFATLGIIIFKYSCDIKGTKNSKILELQKLFHLAHTLGGVCGPWTSSIYSLPQQFNLWKIPSLSTACYVEINIELDVGVHC